MFLLYFESEDKLFDDVDESQGCSQMTQICLWPIYFIPKECRNLDYLMSEINRKPGFKALIVYFSIL